jgi:hypothetical protein
VPIYPDHLLKKYKAKGILIDTNLLMLVVVGTYDPQRVLTFKRTQRFTLDDLALMFRMLEYFDRRVTTPNILTEVDNLTRQLPQLEHDAIATVLSQVTSTHLEVYVPSADIVQQSMYADLGLTDCVTIAAANEVLVLTDDFHLSNVLTNLGHDAININHIRGVGRF